MSPAMMSPETVVELLSRQHQLCDRLVQLTEHQRPLASGDDSDRLLALLGERQKLVLEMEDVARKLRPGRSDWRNVGAGLPAGPGGKGGGLGWGRGGKGAKAISGLRVSRTAGAAYAAAAGQAAGAGNEWT